MSIFDDQQSHNAQKIEEIITVHGLICFQNVFFYLVLLYFLCSRNIFSSHYYYNSISSTYSYR